MDFRYYPRLKQKYPFVIMLITTLIMLTYIILSYSPAPLIFLSISRAILFILYIVLFIVSIRFKRYLYSIYFLMAWICALPVLKVARFGQDAGITYIAPWDFIDIIALLIYIFLCYSYYPVNSEK